jgi:heme exporter protein A
MQQRLSIARALLHEPTIMLLDEPESSLDQQAISLLWRALKKDTQRTIILTSHSLERGLEACDHLVILNRGKIVYQKPAKELDLTRLRQAYIDSTGAGSEVC